MKRIITICAAVLMTASVFAQSPEKMSYQAVVRDGSDALVTSAAVGIQISILQGTANGNAVYVETQTPTANANGLVSVEIGTGTVVSGDFSTIDWANGPYFIKTETDPSGGANYTITGTSELLSVPYALHAKTAASVDETDPAYTQSEAANITVSDITNLGNLSGTNTGDQDLSGYLTAEADPAYTQSEAANITASDITNLSNLSGTNTGDQDLSGYLTAETDPTVAANFDLTTPNDGDVLQYSATAGKWIKQSISGDLTIDNTGTTVLGDGTVTTSKLAEASITSAKILDGEIVNADISSSAGIEQSKIDGLSTSLAAKADLDSPTLTGTPLAPTASVGSDNTQIATTEFVTATIEASPAPQIVGWKEGGASTTEDSEKTIGNLKFRWNTNDYLEVKKVTYRYNYHATMKHYKENGLEKFIGKITPSQTTYSQDEWRPIYRTPDSNGRFNVLPVSLDFYEEMHIELYQQTYLGNDYAHYSIKTFKNGYLKYTYKVTYNILAP